MSNKSASVYAEALKREREDEKSLFRHTEEKSSEIHSSDEKTVQEFSQEKGQETSQVIIHEKSKTALHLPSKDEVEEFNWKLRRENVLKFTTDIPGQWLKELNDLAYQMDVKKLELYRFMIGEFLGKVKRKKPA